MRKLVPVAAAMTVAGVALVAGLRAVPAPDLPPVGLPAPESSDPECVQAARRKPDLVFTSPEWSARPVLALPFSAVPAYRGKVVRVLGFLHVDYDAAFWASYRDALKQQQQDGDVPGVWVRLRDLWPDTSLRIQAPRISDRCARVEAVVVAQDPLDWIELGDVRRLEVWTEPHRPWPPPTAQAPPPQTP